MLSFFCQFFPLLKHFILTLKACSDKLHDTVLAGVQCLQSLPCIFCCFPCFIPSRLLHAAQHKKLAMTYVSACVQLSTTEGNSYYVGTKMDAFVFDTLNTWYQEDMGVNSVRAPFSLTLLLA